MQTSKAHAAKLAVRREMTVAQRRQQIIDQAAVLFDSGSYAATTMDDIAAAVGIAKPTLYHYFASKGQILFDIHEELADSLLSRDASRSDRNLRPRERLLEIMEDVLGFMQTRPGHMRVFFEHYRELPAMQQAIVQTKRERFQSILEQVLTDGIRDGEFRAFDVRLTAFEIVGACIWAYQWYRPGGRLGSREIARQFWDNFIFGIGNESPLPSAGAPPS